jgi:hypothetical protein
MLTSIGVTPVSTLSVPGTTDAAIALDTLRSISKEVQAQGWWFNQDFNVSFAASNSEITVPASVLAIRPSFGTVDSTPESRQFILRDNKLWDQGSKTYTFASTVRADVIYEIEYENLPESFRRYIAIRAARVFQTKVLGDEAQGVWSERHELEAWSIVEGDEVVQNPQSSLFMRRARAVGGAYRADPVVATQGNQRQR